MYQLQAQACRINDTQLRDMALELLLAKGDRQDR
jgi:hypothetical protein